MQKEFACYGRKYIALLDDWLVIIQYQGQDVKVYVTELWSTWDSSTPELTTIEKAVSAFCERQTS